MLSVWDGLKHLTKSVEAGRQGQTASAENAAIMAGGQVLAGVTTILTLGVGVVAGVVVGVFLGIMTLLLGYWCVTLVAPSVQAWVNRSLVGRHEGQLSAFSDMASEQSSLDLVFQGVVVEMSWENIPVNRTTNPIPKRRIMLKVALPQVESMEFRLALSPMESVKKIFEWNYEKTETSDGLVPPLTNDSQRSGNASPSSDRTTPIGASGNEKTNGLEQPNFNSQGDLYVMEWETEVFREDFGEGGGL